MMPLKSISTFISRSIVFSLLLLMAAPVAQAQSSRSKAEWEKMRQKQIDDSIPLFRGVQVMVDLIGPIQRAVSAYGQYEAGVRVNLKDKYFPVVEVGYGEADHTDDAPILSAISTMRLSPIPCGVGRRRSQPMA